MQLCRLFLILVLAHVTNSNCLNLKQFIADSRWGKMSFSHPRQSLIESKQNDCRSFGDIVKCVRSNAGGRRGTKGKGKWSMVMVGVGGGGSGNGGVVCGGCGRDELKREDRDFHFGPCPLGVHVEPYVALTDQISAINSVK